MLAPIKSIISQGKPRAICVTMTLVKNRVCTETFARLQIQTKIHDSKVLGNPKIPSNYVLGSDFQKPKD